MQLSPSSVPTHQLQQTNSHQISYIVLKEKMKLLNEKLKIWNTDTFGNLQRKYKEVEMEMNNLDKKGEDGGLSLEEVVLKKELQERLWRVAMYNESLFWQKSIDRWILEGD